LPVAESFESVAEQGHFGILGQLRSQLEPGVEGDQTTIASAHFEGQAGEARVDFRAGGIGVSGPIVLNLCGIQVPIEPEGVSGLDQQLTN